MPFDARTGFLYMSAAGILMALTIWIILSGQRTRAVQYWCGGSFAVGVASLFFALRGSVPDLLGYTLANLLVFASLAMKVQSLRLESGASEARSRLLFGLLIFLSVFEYLRLVVTSDLLRFSFVFAMLLLMNAWLAGLAWSLWRRQGFYSAFWIAVAHALTVIAYSFRLLNVVLGAFDANILTKGTDALLLAIASIVTTIVSNIGYLGISLNRSTQARLAAATAQARAEENQRLSEQLAQLDRQRCLGTMSASLGHELNQPLAAILTHAQFAQRRLRDLPSETPAPLGEALERIVFNTQRASQIIERIRGFIRPRVPRDEAIDFERLIPEVAQLIAAEARAQRVTLILAPGMPPLKVAGDTVQLSQILVNVLRNAIEATAGADRREIRIDLSADRRHAILRIQDSGPGLTPEALERAGEPFFSTKDSGLGMGLSISHSLAARHGGTLTLRNAAGGGALVELTLPILAPPAQAIHG